MYDTESALRQSSTFCGILLERLQELANFLNSLIQTKDISGNLSYELKRAITKAVDRSFDLSRSINFSQISASQCTNISDMSMIDLVDSLEVSTIADSLVDSLRVDPPSKTEHQFDFNKLKSNLAKSSKTQKNSKKIFSSMFLQQQSESEEWSEPDRDISKERIGLSTAEEISKRSSTTSDEEEGENDFGSEHKLIKKTDWKLINEKIKSLESLLQEKNDKILEVSSMLLDTENDAKNKIIQIKKKIDETEKDLQHYKNIYLQVSNEKCELQKSLQQKDEAYQLLKSEKDKLNIELKVLSTKFESQVECNNDVKSKFNEEKTKYLSLKIEYESKCRTYDQLVNASEKRDKTFRDELQQNWVRKTAYNQLLHELERKQDRLRDYQQKFATMENEMKSLQSQVLMSEEKLEKISDNLDVATLQLSCASVERTKAVNDKRTLEGRLKKISEDYQKLNIEKQELNLKIADLEVFNAKLQNKLLIGDKITICSPLSDASGYVSEDANALRSASFSSNDEKEKEHLIYSNCNSCSKLSNEMSEIKRNLNFSKRALEQAYTKLRNQNLRKAQIEMDIKQQILKTQNVLQNVKANMDMELNRATPLKKEESGF